MAALVGEGLNLGFKIVRYEAQMNCQDCTGEDSIDQREEGQANNLISEIFSKDKKAKVVIWVGYAHAYKRQLGASPKSRWMAARLWQKTGIEPFSIEQLSEQFESNATQPAFDAINTKINSLQPVYVDLRPSWKNIPKEYKWSLRKTDHDSLPAIDAVVVHPKRQANDSRDLWLALGPSDVSKITLTKLSNDKTYLVQVFPNDIERSAINDRVPLDQILCKTRTACLVAVKPGRYLVRVLSDDGTAVSFSEVQLHGFPK
jgi:hypothetical protein